jgi:hypothetical protein
MQTYNGYQWQLSQQRETSGQGELCGPGWLHVYSDPRVAVLLNPQHAAFSSPRLFRATAEGVYRSDYSLKAGVSRLTLVKELELPIYYSHVELVVFAILATRAIPGRKPVPEWEVWADSVLATGQLETEAARAARAAWAAAEAEAARAWAAAEAEAARAAAWAAARAAWAAWAAAEAEAARAAAGAAAEAARAAAWAPYSFIQIVNQLDVWKAAR